MKINFANLDRAYLRDKPSFDAAIMKVLSSSAFIMGSEVNKLEDTLSKFVQVDHAITCSSGTDALLLSLMALEIGPGDEVITTPFTFIATAEVIALLGARPVFVDISPKDFNIDVTKIEAAITPKTKAIIPVSLYGQMPNMRQINNIGNTYNLTVIEDAAQSFGAEFEGRKSGSLSRVSCTSFFPSKPLSCFGDGGSVFTDDTLLADRLRSLRLHGQTGRYVHKYLGICGRLDNLQAAVLNIKMKRYEEDIIQRQSLATTYDKHIEVSEVIKPKLKKGYTSVWAQYTIRVASRKRDDFQKHLLQAGIPTAIHYPQPLHLQECFKELNYKKGMFPISEQLSSEVISLPMNPYFSEEEKIYIVDKVNAF